MSDYDFKVGSKYYSVLPLQFSNNLLKSKDSYQITSYSSKVSIPFTEELSLALTAFFQKCKYPFRRIYEIPFGEPVKSNIRRFFLSLDAYKESSNPVIPVEDILRGAPLKDYCITLKRIRFKSFITSTKSHCLEIPDWWNSIPAYPIQDIGDIFNYQYLINFEQEVNDYLFGNLPLTYDPKAVEEFKSVLRDLLQDSETVDIIDPREILIENSGSSILEQVDLSSDQTRSFKAKKRTKTSPAYLVKGDKNANTFSSNRSYVKRCVVHPYPNGGRDAVINQLPDLNRIKLIEFQTQKVLEANFQEFLVDKDPSDFDKKYKRFQKTYSHFICRDIKKEGITKPRVLLRAMLEVLHEIYPQAKAYESTSFYDDYNVMVNDEIFSPIRGHGLGMANALTSLMQIVLFNMIMGNQSDITIDARSSFLTLNDDIILGFPDRTSLEGFWDAEEGVLTSLGIIRSPEKSFRAHRAGVFVEKYFCESLPRLSRKESYQRRELLIALSATNIVQAKQIVSSQAYIESDILSTYMEEIVSFWGYEFYPNEYLYPISCGGWYTSSIYGISLDLQILNDLPYDEKVYRAYHACKLNHINPKKVKGEISSPISAIFPVHATLIEQDHRLKYGIGSLWEIEKTFSSLKNAPYAYSQAWDFLLKSRRKEYLILRSATYKDFIKEFCSNSNKDFIPLDFMIERSVFSQRYKGKVIDFYSVPNPKLSYLSYLKNIPGIFPNRFDIHFLGSDGVDFKMTADARKRLKRYLGVIPMTYKMSRKDFQIPESEIDFLDLQNSYIHPLRLAKVWGDLYSPLIPILKPEFRNPLINLKKEIYTRFLTKDELISFSKLPKRLDNKRVKILIELNARARNLTVTIPEKVEIPQPEPELIILPEDDWSITEEDFQRYVEGERAPPDYAIFFDEIQAIQLGFEELSNRYDIDEQERTDFIDELWWRYPLGAGYYKKWWFNQTDDDDHSTQSEEPLDLGGFDDFF